LTSLVRQGILTSWGRDARKDIIMSTRELIDKLEEMIKKHPVLEYAEVRLDGDYEYPVKKVEIGYDKYMREVVHII